MRYRLVLLLCASLITACVSNSAVQITPAPTPAQSLGDGVHTLILQSGKVTVKHNRWIMSVPGRFGMPLWSGDLLDVPDTAKGLVVCADLSVRPLAVGLGGVPCPEAPPIIYTRNSRIEPARSAQHNEPLQLVSPRSTRLLTTRPTIRWVAQPDLDTFVISVHGHGVNWTTTATNTTELAYPAKQRALTPGKEYLIEVKADGRSTEDEQTDGRGFILLNDDERAAAEAMVARVTALGLDKAATGIVMARTLMAKGIYADALDQLLVLAGSEPELEVSLLLGDSYLATGLARLAEEQYTAANLLAVAQSDLEAQARAELMLGTIYQEVFGNSDEAKRQLLAALEHYRTLGNQQGADTAEQLLQKVDENSDPTKVADI